MASCRSNGQNFSACEAMSKPMFRAIGTRNPAARNCFIRQLIEHAF